MQIFRFSTSSPLLLSSPQSLFLCWVQCRSSQFLRIMTWHHFLNANRVFQRRITRMRILNRWSIRWIVWLLRTRFAFFGFWLNISFVYGRRQIVGISSEDQWQLLTFWQFSRSLLNMECGRLVFVISPLEESRWLKIKAIKNKVFARRILKFSDQVQFLNSSIQLFLYFKINLNTNSTKFTV